MNAIFQFVLEHGYAVLFAAMFVHQLGLPLPGPLFLLAAGAVAAGGRLNFGGVLCLAVVAIVLADWPWYEAGRKWGSKVLHFIHSFSKDPAYHDRRAKEAFARYGPSILLISKFVPGLDAVAPPLAGTSRTSRSKFVTFDATGATLYAVTYVGLGFVFSDNLERAVAYVSRMGTFFVVLAVAALFIFSAPKLLRQFRFLRARRVQQ